MNSLGSVRRSLFLGCAVLLAQCLLAQDVSGVQAQDTGQSVVVMDPLATQSVLQLDDVLREALKRNPEAQSALHAVDALKRRVPQVKSLPDPMASIGWAGNLTPFSLQQGDPSSYRGISISEQFPYPGKLRLRGEIASNEEDAAQADFEAVRRRIEAEVKAAYYDYFYFDQAIRTTNRNKELLEKLSETTEARYRVGKAMQQDVLRSQIQVSLLIEKLTLLEQQRSTSQARINVFLIRSPESPLPPPTEVTAGNLRYSLDELYVLAARNDTSVLRTQRMVERGRLGVELAEKEYKPDLGVSYMYQQRSSSLPGMNGITFNVSIPIFYKTKQRQGVAEASEDLISAEKMRNNRLNEVKFELKRQYLAAKSSERLLSLYSTGIVPQSSLALESSMASYQVGSVDFLSLIANFTTLLDYETDYYRQLANHETAIALMESLTGTSISDPATSDASSPTPPQTEEQK